MQLRMRGWQGKHGELETADGQPVGAIELGGRRRPDRVDVGGAHYEVATATGRRRWDVSSVDGSGDRIEVRRPSPLKVRYELVLGDGRVLEVAPASRVRRRLAVTDAGTREELGRFERGGAFRTVWTFDVEPLPDVVQAACVWIAVAIDREDEASNVAAVT